jgi:hypothetical protein
VNPNKTVSVVVTFNPGKAGAVQGTLSVSSNATNSVVQIPISATAVAASNPATEVQSTLAASSTALTFGSVTVGTPVTQTVVLTDSGTTNVTLSSVSAKGAGFSASGGNNVTLTPNGSVTISITFNPASAAAVQGNLTISSNASNSALNISLSGTGLAAPTSQHSVSLKWQASSSQTTGYFVYRGSSSSNIAKLFVSTIAATSYTDSSVANGQTYFYAVTSVDANNVESSPSNEVSVTIPSQ